MSVKNNVFFMEIFNEILKINDIEIIIIYDKNNDNILLLDNIKHSL